MDIRITLAALPFILTACDQGPDHDIVRFAQWQAEGANRAESEALQAYLTKNGVGEVIPLRQLVRSDTKWRWCNAEPFDVPPKTLWPNMVPTLRVIREQVKPLVGPVEAQSVFRAPDINRCIKGASRSYHLKFYAIDMRPTNSITHERLVEQLCALHTRKGKALNMGLGIYRGIRFHVDTAGYRRWGRDYHAASSPCTSFVAPQRESR